MSFRNDCLHLKRDAYFSKKVMAKLSSNACFSLSFSRKFVDLFRFDCHLKMPNVAIQLVALVPRGRLKLFVNSIGEIFFHEKKEPVKGESKMVW